MHHINPLGPLLGHCAHMARERMDARMSRYDMTPAQTHVLLYLHHHTGQAPQCEVMEHLRVKPSTAGGILDRMEEKGLVERTVSDSDARKKFITLTEKGEEQQARAEEAFLDVEELLTRNFSAEEKETLFALLHRVMSNLEEDRNV